MDVTGFSSSVGSLIELASAVALYISDVYSSHKERARLIEECRHTTFQLNMLHQLVSETSKNQDRENPWLSSVMLLAEDNGPFDELKRGLETLRSHLPASGASDGTTRRTRQRLMWTFDKKTVAEVLRKLERVKSLVILALQRDTMTLTSSLNERFGSGMQRVEAALSRGFEYTEESISRVQGSLDSQERNSLLNWLSPLDFAGRLRDNLVQREPGTGLGFLKSPEYKEWREDSKRVLWCTGAPGSGKTMIASIAIEEIKAYCQNQEHSVLYLFCSSREQTTQTLPNLLGCLLKQSLRGTPDFPPKLHELYENNQALRPIATELRKTLHKELITLDPVHIVVDGLDESIVGDDLVEQLCLLPESVKLLFTSRSPPILENGCSRLVIRANDIDLQKYVGSRVKKSRFLTSVFRGKEVEKSDLASLIASKADGMFLVARLYMDSLANKLNARAVRQAIQAMPDGLYALYEDALHRIQSQTRDAADLAHRVLSWVVHAQRPLSMVELQHAIATEIGDSSFDPDGITESGVILSTCSGLVVFDEAHGVVGLVHQTAYAFFRESTHKSYLSEAQALLSMTCLTYLSFEAFESGPCADASACRRRCLDYPLLKYAAVNWGSHISKRPSTSLHETLVLPFLLHDGRTGSSSQIFRMLQGDDSGFSQYHFGYGIHLAAQFGLKETVFELVERNVDIDQRDSLGQTALMLVEEVEIAEMLLERGANPNAQTRFHDTALQIAASKGLQAIVEILLARGADPNIQGSTFASALQAALWNRHHAIVELLLESGADPDLQKPFFGNALQVAALNGDEDTVSLLLRRGANPNDSGDTYGDALQSASYAGHLGVAKLLLRYGVQVDSIGGFYGNALQAAAFNGKLDVVKLLLDHGADPNAEGGHLYGEALQAAAFNGYETIVRTLLDHGAEMDTESGGFGSALQASSLNGHIEIVQLLLSRGADVNARGGRYGCALNAAASGGHEAIHALLVDSGAKIDYIGGCFGIRSLSWSPYEPCHPTLLSLLVGHGIAGSENW